MVVTEARRIFQVKNFFANGSLCRNVFRKLGCLDCWDLILRSCRQASKRVPWNTTNSPSNLILLKRAGMTNDSAWGKSDQSRVLFLGKKESKENQVLKYSVFEHIELPANLIDYFLRSNKININHLSTVSWGLGKLMWELPKFCPFVLSHSLSFFAWNPPSGNWIILFI